MPVNKERLYADVEFLTTLPLPRNHYNESALRKAAAYIENEFRQLDCEVTKQALHKGYENIIAFFGPEDAPRIIIGAHYDVADDTPGADDNASAVAGLLELARMVHEEKPHLTHRLEFVAYNFEEPPYFGTEKMGSAVHARSLVNGNVKVELMICLEMIGYFSDEPGSQCYQNESLKGLYPDVGNFIAVIGKVGQEETVQKIYQSMKANSTIDVQYINAPTALPGISLSDHRNYWAEGYQAVMINDTSYLRNPNYHQATDVISTLDFDRMVEVVKGVYAAILEFKVELHKKHMYEEHY